MDHSKNVLKDIAESFGMGCCKVHIIPEHEGGRNCVYVLEDDEGKKYILRLSMLDDRTENDYLAETEFIRYLSENGASVANVIPSENGNLVEHIKTGDADAFASLFEYAPGMLISDNGYRYREGAPLSEYFYNTGKTLGKIHALSKTYVPFHRRSDYFDKYNMAYIEKLIPDTYVQLKRAISERLNVFKNLPKDRSAYGLVHFDFSDGNYHINMKNGELTVFDFDNAMYCWYMFDLANLWTHGVGWCQFEEYPKKRQAFMEEYFNTVLSGYRSETDLSDDLLDKLTLFIDMVLIENIVDEFECCQRAGEEVDYDDIRDASESLIHNIPWAGFFEE